MHCKCRVVQILGSSETCDKCGLKTKETSWPNTDYRYNLTHKSFNMLLYCKERVGLNWEGCCPLQFWQTHAVKFDKLLKVCRTLTELRAARFKFVKCVKVRKPGLLAEPWTEEPCCKVCILVDMYNLTCVIDVQITIAYIQVIYFLAAKLHIACMTRRAGQNRIYIPYMTVYLVIFLPKYTV